jgi:hypothetical protein
LGKEKNGNLRRFAADTVSYLGGPGFTAVAEVRVPLPARPEHPPEAVQVVPLSSYRKLAEQFVPIAAPTARNGAILRAKEGFFMARFTLCFILLAAALSHASPPASTLDSPFVSSNFAALDSPMATANWQQPLVATESRNDIARASANEGICYKIRAYIFRRDDDHAPQFVRSTTCGPGQPRAKDAVWPKARMVPAD